MDAQAASFVHDIWPVVWPVTIAAIGAVATLLNHRSNLSDAQKRDTDRLIDASVKAAHNFTPDVTHGVSVNGEQALELAIRGLRFFKENGGRELLHDTEAVRRIAAELKVRDALPDDFHEQAAAAANNQPPPPRPFDLEEFVARLPGIVGPIVDGRIKAAAAAAEAEHPAEHVEEGRPAEGQAA
jgi:hypothetical protein